FGFGFGINSGTAPSFAAGYLNIPRESLGLLEAMREVPGLLTAGVIGLVAALAEPRLAAFALLFLAAGIGATGQVRPSAGPGGAAIAAGSLFAARIPAARGGGLAQRLIFRPSYWRYYCMMLLDGGRRQIVQTFALLILVKEFGVDRRVVPVLLLVNGLLIMAA